jgi:hypothetical protein
MFQEIRHVHTSKGLFYDVNPKKNIGIFRPKNHGGEKSSGTRHFHHGDMTAAMWRNAHLDGVLIPQNCAIYISFI